VGWTVSAAGNVRLSREDLDAESPIPPLRRFTVKVMGRWRVKTVDVRADGTGFVVSGWDGVAGAGS
jgi:hypothetical protein